MPLHDPRSAQRRDRLLELSRRDPEPDPASNVDYRIFGASGHRYASRPVELVEIARVQAVLGYSIPVEYRNFLLDVGYGAGPYYGLWSPLAGVEELERWARHFETRDGTPLTLSSGFPVTGADLRAWQMGLAEGVRPVIEYPWPCGGCLPICHQGSSHWSVLVLAGEFAGRVWDLACHTGFNGQWTPAGRPTGRYEAAAHVPLPPLPAPPTFGEWFDGWLEQGLADLPEALSASRWSWPWSRKP